MSSVATRIENPVRASRVAASGARLALGRAGATTPLRAGVLASDSPLLALAGTPPKNTHGAGPSASLLTTRR
jgi:hypothetical protein